MKHLTIKRKHRDNGVLSEIVLSQALDNLEVLYEFYGIERPWRDNAPSVSCIPSGLYVLIPYNSSKYPDVWAFYGGTVGVERGERTRCLIHSANYAHQVQGCLGLGMQAGETNKGEPAVWKSRDAVNRLRGIVGAHQYMTCDITWD